MTHPSNQAFACHDTTDCIMTHSLVTSPLSPVTIQSFVSRHSPPSTPRACALPAVLQPSLSVVLQHCSAVSWPSPAISWSSLPGHAHPVSRYNPLFRDSHKEEMGSSPFQPLLQPFFFFTHFFFSFCFTYWKTQKIYYFFFHFPVEQINSLKKNFLFFFQFYTL